MRGTGPVRGKHICPRDVRQPESEHHLSRSPSPSWLGCFKQRLQFKVPRHVTVGCSRDEQRPKRGCLISLLMRRKSRVESANRDGYGISALACCWLPRGCREQHQEMWAYLDSSVHAPAWMGWDKGSERGSDTQPCNDETRLTLRRARCVSEHQE